MKEKKESNKEKEREEFDHFCLLNHTELSENYHLASTDLFHNESCDTSLISIGVGLCINNEDVGVRPVCDPELVSVQDVVVAFRKKKKHRTKFDFRHDPSDFSLGWLHGCWGFLWRFCISLRVVRLWNSTSWELEECPKHIHFLFFVFVFMFPINISFSFHFV